MIQEIVSKRQCSLIGYSGEGKQEVDLPLRSIDYTIQICDSIAEVVQTQIYHNFTNQFLQVQFRFPINPESCMYRFIATFGDKRIEGAIQEKEQAKQDYKNAINQGKMAAYGQMSQESKDIMNIQIGNIPPLTDVTIQVRCIQELKISLNTFYCFDLPIRMTPKYFNKIPKKDFLQSFREKHETISGHFQWNFMLKVRSNRKIITAKSTTHSIKLQSDPLMRDQQKHELCFTLDDDTLDRDFIFIYTTQDFQLPSFTLGQNDQNTTVMVSFIPKFCSLNLVDAEKAAFQNQKLQVDMESAKGEYVFLLDRSGSMSGTPIENAKKALILFLKSLPVDSYFNVISFGTFSSKMFTTSQRNSNKQIEYSIEEIEGMSADLGGTEIQEPLESILKSQVIEGFPKQIFLLTDGGVSNTQSVIELVRRNIKYSRVHTIGLGNQVSRDLIQGCAKSGKGLSVFIGDNQNPSQKIIQLLIDSLSAVISKVELKFNQSLVQRIVPNPTSIPYILKGQIANFFITFKGLLKQKTKISLTYRDSFNNLPYIAQAIIDPSSRNFPFIDKMGHFKTIRALEISEADGGKVEDRIFFVKAVDKKKQVIDLSIKHNILSKFTSFLCLEKELIDGRYEEVSKKGKIQLNIQNIQNKVDVPIHPIQSGCARKQLVAQKIYRKSAPLLMSSHSSSFGIGKGGRSVGGKGKCGVKRTAQKRYARSSIEGITKADIRRLARKGGVRRISSFIYDDARVQLKNFLEVAVKNSITYCEYARRKTVTAMDVIYSLRTMNRPLYLSSTHGLETSSKTHKKPTIPHIPFTKKKNKINKTKMISKKLRAPLPTPHSAFLTQPQSLSQPQLQIQEMDEQEDYLSLVIKQQKTQGLWNNITLIDKLFSSKLSSGISNKESNQVIVTLLIIQWMQKHHPLPQYKLIIKKAKNWAIKQSKYVEYAKMYENYVK